MSARSRAVSVVAVTSPYNALVIRKYAALLVLPLLAVALQGQQSALAPTGTLRAVMLATNPVQGRVDEATGQVTGVVPDVVKELARRRNIAYTLTPVPDAAAVIERVRTGQADIGFLAIEAERATQVDFSEPYLLMGSRYLVRADSPIRTSADVDTPGTRVGAVTGQSQQVFVSEHLKQARVVLYPVMPADDVLNRALVSGELDVFAANTARMAAAAAKEPRVRVLSDNFMATGQAIIVPKGDAARLADVNRFVAELRATTFVADAIARDKLAGAEPAK
jgi:polar amino acid transport system substrate-binding protein